MGGDFKHIAPYIKVVFLIAWEANFYVWKQRSHFCHLKASSTFIFYLFNRTCHSLSANCCSIAFWFDNVFLFFAFDFYNARYKWFLEYKTESNQERFIFVSPWHHFCLNSVFSRGFVRSFCLNLILQNSFFFSFALSIVSSFLVK